MAFPLDLLTQFRQKLSQLFELQLFEVAFFPFGPDFREGKFVIWRKIVGGNASDYN